ncbi:YaiI/YqxD family protein [Staphylococcus massiliensis CCUG 55927]|uniref:YaiI/YqxD family protein n=1 Tax=Staphylococcus massiliensis TaxID=555791 RepID=UPI000366ED31|nr:YaiI/YqxD family protein [Staphylococcus massiliensis]PNZ98469.1 YaiI/YqxD family protein [Staphylococcus massiliensis CCUG 55927]
MTRIIIDGDACPVVDSIVELTAEAGISVLLVRSFSHFSHKMYPEHVNTIYVDNGSESADYKIMQLCNSQAIVVTQDYGLASLLLSKALLVMHHSGKIYTKANIDMLLLRRYEHAKMRQRGGRHGGPSAFTKEQRKAFEMKFKSIIEKYG